MQKAGSRMGTGTMIVLDDNLSRGVDAQHRTLLRARVLRLVHALWGLSWVAQILQDMEEGRGRLVIWRSLGIAHHACSAPGRPFARWRRAPWTRGERVEIFPGGFRAAHS